MGIQSLPDELLVIIFEYGGFMSLQDAKATLPFIISASRVSQRWKHIILCSPSVWRNIPITQLDDLTLPLVFLQRSGNYGLNIFVHAKGARTEEAICMILDHAHRWTRLFIRAATAPFLFVVISRLRRAHAPNLQQLEIYVDANPASVGQLPTIFSDDPPRLSSIRLEGATFDFRSPLLSGLSRLTLAKLPRGMAQPTWTMFRDLLNASPMLEYLGLDGVFPRLFPDIQYDQILIPHLHTLDLTIYPNCDYIQQLFACLSVPVIHTLKLTSDWNLAWNQFEMALPVLAAMYSHLRELHFFMKAHTPFMDQETSPYFFKAFPELRVFVLNVFDGAFARYFLEPWAFLSLGSEDELGEGNVVAFIEEDGPIWPKLELLTVRAPYDMDDDDNEMTLDDLLELLGSIRLSMSLPFDVLQGFIFEDVNNMPALPPSY